MSNPQQIWLSLLVANISHLFPPNTLPSQYGFSPLLLYPFSACSTYDFLHITLSFNLIISPPLLDYKSVQAKGPLLLFPVAVPVPGTMASTQ